MASTSAVSSRLASIKVGRGLEGFTARQREDVELQPCGVAELDALLGGGFPRGALVEVCGTASSGRTSLTLALLAQATSRQEACAFVDVSDALDPMSVAAAGVDARRLLWVRCGGNAEIAPEAKRPWGGEKQAETGLGNGVEADPENKIAASAKEAVGTATNGSGARKQFRVKQASFAWTHPRDAMRGVETSIPPLMRRPIKAPGYEEMSFAVRCAGEQVEPDRQEPRRGENVRRRFDSQRQGQHGHGEEPALKKREWSTHAERANYVEQKQFAKSDSAWIHVSAKPWKRLEQALKTTDLLLHSGGWGVVVVDLGGISWVEARRIPMHTWFRFRRVVENSPTILLLLGEESCAKSCASLVLRCQRVGEKWVSAAGEARTAGEKGGEACFAVTTLQGFAVQGEIACSRMQRLGVEKARWETRTF